MGKAFAFAVMAVLLWQTAQAGFTERVLVQVFDQNLRPVEGASAYAEYQLNSVTGLVKTKPKYTDKSGQVNVTFTNYEVLEDSVVHTYTLFIAYGNQLATYPLIAGNGSNSRVLSETSFRSCAVLVKARDQRNSPLRAEVSVGGKNATADESGNAAFQLPPGNYTVRAEIEGAVKTKSVQLAGDTVVDMEFGLYPLKVYVKDDRRVPLNATVEAGGKTVRTDSDGLASFENITMQSPQVVVTYGERVKKFPIDLERQDRQDVVFDNTKPEVKELHATLGKDGSATLSLYVEDPGALSSGIESVLISYEVEGLENKVPAYTIGYNTFEARIPAQAPLTLVKYTVKVADKEGNSAFGSGTYVVPEEGAAGNSTGPGTKPPAQQAIGVEAIIVGIIIFALLAYGAFYYRRNRGGGAGGQAAYPPQAQPQSPPQVPPQIPQQ